MGFNCPLRCNDCIYFKDRKLPTAEDVCCEQGMFANSLPCSKFFFNFKKVNIIDDEVQKSLIGALHKAHNTSALNIMMGVAMQERVTRKYGFTIGDVYYFKMFAPNYLSSYFKVVVLAADENYVQIQGIHRGKVWYGEVFKSTLLNEEEFFKIEKSLKAKGLIKDPKYKDYFKAPDKTEKKVFVKKVKKSTNDLEDKADEILKAQPITELDELDSYVVKPKERTSKVEYDVDNMAYEDEEDDLDDLEEDEEE